MSVAGVRLPGDGKKGANIQGRVDLGRKSGGEFCVYGWSNPGGYFKVGFDLTRCD